MTRPLYLFVGLESEYVLAPLARHFRTLGHECLEIDFSVAGWRDRIAAVGGRPIVLITSHHPYMDRYAFRAFYGATGDVLSVPELIGWLKPSACYFVPHDLTEPLKPDEISSLSLFDAIFMPNDDYWSFQRYTRVVKAGWIKTSAAQNAQAPAAFTIAFLPSEFVAYRRLGAAAFKRAFDPILALKPVVKPVIMPDIDAILDTMRSSGCALLPAQTLSSEVIQQASIVVTNAMSSIGVEAALAGVPVICIEDGIHDPQLQRRAYAAYPEVRLMPCEAAARWLKTMQSDPSRCPPRLASEFVPFDFDGVTSLIVGG